jgi:hypothetical protein
MAEYVNSDGTNVLIFNDTEFFVLTSALIDTLDSNDIWLQPEYATNLKILRSIVDAFGIL